MGAMFVLGAVGSLFVGGGAGIAVAVVMVFLAFMSMAKLEEVQNIQNGWGKHKDKASDS
jgi:uncharacterized membrane protein